MQAIVAALCEKIHELINHEHQRSRKDDLCIQKQFDHRLAMLEKKLTAFENSASLSTQTDQSSQVKRQKYRINGADITAIRNRLNLSQATFARLLGVNRACVNRWEHEKVKPSQRSMSKIAEYRKMGKKELFERMKIIEDEMWK